MSPSILRSVIQPQSHGESGGMSSGKAGDLGDSESTDMELVLGVLVENAPVAMAMFDRSMRYMLANRQWIGEFGLSHVTPLVGKSQYEVFPSLHPGWRQVYERALQGHVVRSEHDALSDTDGRQVVYRWEVRPWRRERDATVGGLMVTCERFSPPLAIGSGEESDASVSSSQKAAPIRELVADPIFESALPTVVLNSSGIIERANEAAVGLTLARGIREGVSAFWDVFSPSKDAASLRSKVQEAVEKLRADILPSASEVIVIEGAHSTSRPMGEPTDAPGAPKQWVLSSLKGSDGKALLAVGMPHAPAPESVRIQVGASSETAPKSAFAPAPAAPKLTAAQTPDTSSEQAAEIRRLKEDLARAHHEIRGLQESEGGFVEKDSLQREVLNHLPCGILVLDSRGVPIFQNQNLGQLLGRPIERQETVEHWLSEACPNDAHRAQVTNVWREDVWRRQLTRTVSLATADGLLKEVEFQPISLPDGQLLINLLDVTESSRHEEQLLAMEAKFRALLQENPVPVVLMDKSGAIFEVNHAAEELLLRPKSELRRHSLDTWLQADSAKARREALAELKQNKSRSTTIKVTVLPNEKPPVTVDLGITLVRDASDEPHCTIHFLRPVSAPSAPRPAAPSVSGQGGEMVTEPTFEESEAEVSWLTTNLNGRIVTISDPACEALGLTREFAHGRPLHTLFRPSDATGFYGALFQATSSDAPVAWPILTQSGERLERQWKIVSGGRGGYDIELIELVRTSCPKRTPEATAPQESAPSTPTLPAPPPLMLPDRTWPVANLEREQLILSETHHRIKNHLQILSSLLNLQSNSVADQDARMALRSSQNRVRAIAALHQQLYEASLGDGENFSDFAHGLVHRLRECYSVPQERVEVRLEIQSGRIEQEWLVPLALTLNETISNCFEHGFPENRSGKIEAQLHFSDQAGELRVMDDGIGPDADFNAGESTGLGLKILAVFASQLRGQFSIQPNRPSGTIVNLRFPIASADI